MTCASSKSEESRFSHGEVWTCRLDKLPSVQFADSSEGTPAHSPTGHVRGSMVIKRCSDAIVRHSSGGERLQWIEALLARNQ